MCCECVHMSIFIHVAFFCTIGSKTDFQSEPFNITVMKYSTTIMCHIPIFPDMALAYRKIFGLKFSISDEVSVKVGSTSESRAIIINTDREFYIGSALYQIL